MVEFLPQATHEYTRTTRDFYMMFCVCVLFSTAVVSQITKAQLWKPPASLCEGSVIHEDGWDVSGGFSWNMMSCLTAKKKNVWVSVYIYYVFPEGALQQSCSSVLEMILSWELNSPQVDSHLKCCPVFLPGRSINIWKTKQSIKWWKFLVPDVTSVWRFFKAAS